MTTPPRLSMSSLAGGSPVFMRRAAILSPSRVLITSHAQPPNSLNACDTLIDPVSSLAVQTPYALVRFQIGLHSTSNSFYDIYSIAVEGFPAATILLQVMSYSKIQPQSLPGGGSYSNDPPPGNCRIAKYQSCCYRSRNSEISVMLSMGLVLTCCLPAACLPR